MNILNGARVTIDTALSLVKRIGFADAVCVGGALRDSMNGVPLKDIDIFVTSIGDFVSEATLIEDVTHVKPTPLFVGYRGEHSFDVKHVFYIGDINDVPIQIIVLKEPKTVMEKIMRVDFGMCQIGWDGEQLHTTDAFWKDFSEKTFTVTRCDSEGDHARTMRRWERLNKKYPNHTLVDETAFKGQGADVILEASDALEDIL